MISSFFMRGAVVVCASLSLAACAQRPDGIKAALMSEEPYKGMNCSQLAEKSIELNTRLNNDVAQQRRTANNDLTGVLVIGLPLGTMSGDDVASEIALLKGEVNALHRVGIAKRCPPPFASPAPGAPLE